MTERVDAQGNKNDGYKWDEESDHDDVTKIYVRSDSDSIQSIRFDYVKNGKPINGSLHGESYDGYTQTVEINHLKNEQLVFVEGYCTESGGINGLRFVTNLRFHEPMGYTHGNYFKLAVEGKKIIGFHGSAEHSKVYSLGAYFTLITPTRMEPKGGNGGKEWDDGADYEAITKIHVRSGHEGIQFIKFEYVDKDGHPKDAPRHGSISGKGSPHVFEIQHVNNEYLISIEGYYDEASEVIHGLQFKTNNKTSELMGSNKGKKFRLATNGMKVIGFHGFADKKNLISLGAYFTMISPTRSLHHGGGGSRYWDDGAFEGVRKVYIYHYDNNISCLRFNYENNNKVESRDHGMEDGDLGEEDEFVVDYPYELITYIRGTLDSKNYGISSLMFKTSKGKTSKVFGSITSDAIEFVIEKKGCAIVGFHGCSYSSLLRGLGAYFYPMPLPPAAEKLEAQGGDGGDPWDDGADFESVRKIYIGIGEIGIVSLKFLYQNDTHEVVVGDDHGNKTLLGHEEFELDYPSEYLTSVEGSYDEVSDESEGILMLKFSTNKRISPCYGFEDDPSFVLHKEGHKIVGFHGKSSKVLNKIGVHVLPITHP